jgi:MFS transporter, DHA1 family, multidrug resistance protein
MRDSRGIAAALRFSSADFPVCGSGPSVLCSKRAMSYKTGMEDLQGIGVLKSCSPAGAQGRGAFFVAVSQFGMAFSFHVVLAFLPFHIMRISPFGPKETMVWIGLILGSTNVIAALAASFWGGLTSRFSPKLLFERGILCNGILILVMGFTENLYVLLLLRIIQGFVGGVSTIGLILISCLSSEENLRKDVSFFQNSISAGQLVGPPVGAYLASFLGYRAPFVFSAAIVSLFLVFCHLNVKDIPRYKRQGLSGKPMGRGILLGWALSLMVTVQITFLPSILPNVLEAFRLTGDAALHSAGLIIMSYTGTAILGNFFLSRLTFRMGLKRVIGACCIIGALFQILLIFGGGPWSFAVIRMIQVGFIAVVIPLTICIFARDAGGRVMGFLNSSRFVGAAIGPFMATSIVAYSNLLTLYTLIAGMTLVFLWAFLVSGKGDFF